MRKVPILFVVLTNIVPELSTRQMHPRLGDLLKFTRRRLSNVKNACVLYELWSWSSKTVNEIASFYRLGIFTIEGKENGILPNPSLTIAKLPSSMGTLKGGYNTNICIQIKNDNRAYCILQ